jgi:Concanavalin A-like lectin/glucanases superfamily
MDVTPLRQRVRRAVWAPPALLLAAIGASPARADDSASILRAYWPLDERSGQVAHDLSGNANDGQLGSTPWPDGADPHWVDGRLGGGLGFDGDNDYVKVADSPSLETPPTLTVTAGFRGFGSPGEWRYLVSKGSLRCNRASYGLYSGENGGLGFYVSSQAGFVVSPLANRRVWDGDWHQAAGSFDGRAVRLFVDGEEIGNGTSTRADIAYGLPGESAYLGAYRGDCDLMLKGELDDVAIWGRALSVPEVGAVAHDGPRAVVPATVQPPAIGRPTARCTKPKGSRRRCRLKVSFLVRRPVRLRIDLARLRGRRAKTLASVRVRVGPPRVTIPLPRRVGGRPIARGRYRVTLVELDGARPERIASTTGRVR